MSRTGRGRAAQRWRKLEKKEWRCLLRARLGPGDSGADDGAGGGTGEEAGAFFVGSRPVCARILASLWSRARMFELKGFRSGGGMFAEKGGGWVVGLRDESGNLRSGSRS